MRISIPFLSLAFLLLFSPVQAAQNSIVILGDSLSAAYGIAEEDGWVQKLRDKLAVTGYEDYRVINASISGDTTDGGLARLPALLEQYQPTLVVIALGGNDGLRGFSLKQIRGNLQSMVQKAKAQNASAMIVGVTLPPNYGAAYIRRFEAVFQKVASTENVALVPSLVDKLEQRLEWLQKDGIHPNEAAQELLLDNVWPTLMAQLPDQH